jgi:hypothetical protein
MYIGTGDKSFQDIKYAVVWDSGLMGKQRYTV